MNIIEWVLIGLGLSMDAAAVSLCKGMAACRVRRRDCLLAGLYFGGFQGLMPAIGYALGNTFAALISRYAHWVSFALLAFIGGNMLRESFEKEESCETASFRPSVMLPLAVATSIDALAVGVSFSFYMNWGQMLAAVGIIVLITFIIATAAVKLGSLFGARFNTIAERLGGCILILIGLKLLLEGLGVWPFGG